MKKTALFLILALLITFSSCTITLGPTAKGNLSGSVNDASTGAGLSGVMVSLYNSTGSLKGSTTTSISGAFSLTSITEGTGYYAVYSKSNYYQATYRGIAITANETTYLETLLQVNSTLSGTGYASGTIIDAFNGNPIVGATVDFFAGVNTTSGSLLHYTSTNNVGLFSVNTIDLASAGNFTARISKSGYTTTTFTVTLVAGATIANQNASLTPNIDTSEYRIILDWGLTPYDLDSHLTGPTEDGINRFHTYYSNKSYTPTGGLTADVALDRDDRDSYGPETTTIYNKRSGEYRFYIHDYTNNNASSSSTSTALSNSGARVRVYKGSSLIATYNVPTGYGGNCWDVFKLSGTSLTAVNTMSYISDYAIGRDLGREDIFANLPEKKKE